MFETRRLALLLTGLMLCSAAAAQDVVGQMGDVELHGAELRAILEAQSPEMRRQLATNQAALEKLVRNELMRKAVLYEAKLKGWDKRQDLQPLFDRAREQVIVSSFIGSIARPGDSYPSEEEIRQFYDSNKANLLAPPRYQLAQIFLPAAEGGDPAKDEAARKKIDELSVKLSKSGASFAKLAQENSAHKESADKGGEIGWVAEDQMVPEIRRAVTALSKGEVSPPVKSAAGWHLIKLLDKKTAAPRPLADIRADLVVAMRNRKTQELERAYLDALAVKLPLTVNQAELGKVQSALH